MSLETVALVYWVLRGESVTLDAEPTAGPTPGGTKVHFDDITRALVERGSDFAPYPPFLARHLEPIDAYLVALATSPVPATEGGRAVNIHEDGELPSSVEPAAVSVKVVAAIGVVWVDLSAVPRGPANAVQGYLQIVVTRDTWRRRGIGRALLCELLNRTDRTQICTGYVGSFAKTAGASTLSLVRAATASTVRERREADGVTAIARPIASWMLHTMAADSVATRAYLRHRLQKNRPPAAVDGEGSGGGHGEGAGAPLTGADPRAPGSLAARVEEQLTHVRAVTALYEGLGFTRRRTLYRYYGGLADGTEMVRNIDAPRKARRMEGESPACRGRPEAVAAAVGPLPE